MRLSFLSLRHHQSLIIPVPSRFIPGRTLRSRSSPAPCVSYEGVIKVAYTKIDGGAAEGYIHSALNAFGEYGIRNELDGALHVKFCASLTTNEVFEITTLVSYSQKFIVPKID